jgi:hypothetical protein
MAQLVGQPCAICRRPIGWEGEGRFCQACGCAVHNTCPATAPRPGGECDACGSPALTPTFTPETKVGHTHAVETVGDEFHLRATAAFAARERFPVGCAIALWAIPGIFVIVAVGRQSGGEPVAALLSLVGLLVAGYFILRESNRVEPPRDPLVITRAGRIVYRSAVLFHGPVTAVRVVQCVQNDSMDTFSIECRAADGATVQLPWPDFGGTVNLHDITALAFWLGRIWGVTVEDQVVRR